VAITREPGRKAKGRGVEQKALTGAGGSRQERLFRNEPPPGRPDATVKRLRYPVWTQSKARVIQSYLRLFTFITKHGTYIDAFAGPQTDKPEMWSAKLVLECEPRWLRHFHLFEQNKTKVAALEELIVGHAQMLAEANEKSRDLHVHPGDCNEEIPKLLAASPIRDKEATFALLDQRTFECHWETVRALAAHKKGGHKIELFYFLPNAWLPRSIAGLTKRHEVGRLWWGQDGWQALGKMTTRSRAELFTRRIREELGYASVMPWPINEREAGGGNVMYFMIHATDHPEAPILMRRAFEHAVDPTKPAEQLALAHLGVEST
jgi:three-Cys-motif partner protein